MAMVPETLMVPPDNPVPAVIEVTVPEPPPPPPTVMVPVAKSNPEFPGAEIQL